MGAARPVRTSDERGASRLVSSVDQIALGTHGTVGRDRILLLGAGCELLKLQGGLAVDQLTHERGASEHVADQINPVFGAGQRNVEQPVFLCMRIRLRLRLQGLNERVSHDFGRKAVLAFAKTQQNDVVGFLALGAMDRIVLEGKVRVTSRIPAPACLVAQRISSSLANTGHASASASAYTLRDTKPFEMAL